MDSQSQSMRDVVFGNFNVVFKCPVTYEPPLYLLPELLAGTSSNDPIDRVVSAVDLESSRWIITSLQQPLTDEMDGAARGNSTAAPVDDQLARLVIQGALTPMNLDTMAMDPQSGFSARKVIRNLESLAEALHRSASARPRSIVKRVLTVKESQEEAEQLRKVVMTNHFVNVLAWQRSEELLSALTEAHSAAEVTKAEMQQTATTASQVLLPSKDPWQSAYEDNFISCPELNAERRISLYRDLSKQFATQIASWKSLSSTGVQTEDDLKRRNAGMVQTLDPFVKSSAETCASETVATVVNVCASKGPYQGESETPTAVSYWSMSMHTITDSTEEEQRSVTLTLLNEAGCIAALGRTSGYAEDVGVAIHSGIGFLSAVPKRISPLHATLHVTQEGTLTVTAAGRNGLRIVGKKHLLAGHSYDVPASAASSERPCCVALAADVMLKIVFVPSS